MMKAKTSAPLKGLFFRELYLGRRTYIAVTGIFFGIVTLILLVLLSMKVGNLAKLPADVIESAKGTIRMAAMFVPSAIFFMNTSVVVDTAPADLSEKWLRFMYSSPVSEGKILGVKFSVMFITAAVGYGLSALLALAVGALMGEPATITDFGIIAAIMLIVVLFSILITVLSYAFKSTTGAIVIVLILAYFGMGIIIGLAGVGNPALSDEELFQNISDIINGFCESVFPLSPLILVGMIALGWGLCTAILKHRDAKRPQLFRKKEKPAKDTAKEE